MNEPKLPHVYDKQGNPITDPHEFGRLYSDPEYKIIARTLVHGKHNKRQGVTVSTVWLGVDHGLGFNSDQPVIFETMVFGVGSLVEEVCWRYYTEEQAQEGHAELVRYAQERFSDPQTEDRKLSDPL